MIIKVSISADTCPKGRYLFFFAQMWISGAVKRMTVSTCDTSCRIDDVKCVKSIIEQPRNEACSFKQAEACCLSG